MKMLIIGAVASGKTTLARRFSAKSGVAWYELDCVVYHQTPQGRFKRTPAQQREVLCDIDKRGDWIMEGVDRESYGCLYDMAERIIFLDTPPWTRRARVISRFLRQKLGIERCHYQPEVKMLLLMYKWTRDFEKNRLALEEKLATHQHKVTVVKNGNRFKL